MELLENQYVKELEVLHNVDIETDAVDLACSIVGRYYEVIMVKRGNTNISIPDSEMLKVEALWMLEKASLELKINDDTELKRFDREAYLIFRNLVELSEFRKEKALPEGRSYFSYLEKENENLRYSLNEVVENCKSVFVWQKNPQRMVQLVKLRECVIEILNSEICGDEINYKLRDLHTLINEYKRNIPGIFMQYRTVSPRMVAKIASLLTGIPTSWLLNSFRPQVACLRERLAREVVGQDHAIHRIAKIMSRCLSSGNGSSPLASFLFLPGSWIRIEEFFESLVAELYDSKDRLVWFNLKMHTNSSSSSDADIRDKCDAIQEKVIEVVKSTPFCALLFENVGACEYTTAFLENILKHGTVVDKQGNTYNLSNTLIIMTSVFDGGLKERQALNCNCKHLEIDHLVEADATRAISSKDLECKKLMHKKVLGSLWGIHELVDDVLVLNYLRPLGDEVFTRVQLRNELDASRKEKQLIVYPSEAAIQFIFRSYADRIQDNSLESFIKKAVIPVIHRDIKRIRPHNMATIHMDVLVGSMKLSCRSLEVGRDMVAFKESLVQWKTLCQDEKRSATEIVQLSTSCSQLLSLIQKMNELDKVTKWLKDMQNILNRIISDLVNSNNFFCEQSFVPPKIETKGVYRVTNCSNSDVKEGVRSKLSSAPGGKYQLLNFIADAISSTGPREELCCHPKSFLFLGLTDNTKADLFNALSCLFESEDACESIIQINLEEYMDSDSLKRFVDCIVAFAVRGSSGTDLSLSDSTRTSHGRVLLIDGVGKANISVFSALLSLLDHGALTNKEGKLVDFCKIVIIITSDIGNKDILAGLGGHAMGSIIKEKNADRRTREAFRFELLNRIDEIVIFDPLLELQLEKFYRLRINMEQVLHQKLDIFKLLEVLCWNLDAARDDMRKGLFVLAVKSIALDIMESWKTSVVHKREFSTI